MFYAYNGLYLEEIEMQRRIEKMEANGLGWQIISAIEARAILRQYRLSLRNLGNGLYLNGISLRWTKQ